MWYQMFHRVPFPLPFLLLILSLLHTMLERSTPRRKDSVLLIESCHDQLERLWSV
jgi:hypothetical protein